MSTTTTPMDDRISIFAAAVRDALNDLPADDVDELVDGLEADLAEQANERGEGYADEDPVAYAAELRAAAGLPERHASTSKLKLSLIASGRALRDRAVSRIRSTKFGSWLIDTLTALRPVWWVARGWLLYVIIAPILGVSSHVFFLPSNNLGAVLLLLVVVTLSVQWGRGFWANRKWLEVARTATSVVAAIGLPFLVVGTANSVYSALDYLDYATNGEPAAVSGLAVDGERVWNIYAYDGNGEPIEAVQLFDENGRPLTTIGRMADPASPWDGAFYGEPVQVPLIGANGAMRLWNVFPLQEIPADSIQDAEPNPNLATPPPFPMTRVPSINPSPSATLPPSDAPMPRTSTDQ